MITFVAVFAMVLGYVALLAAYLAMRTLAKLRRATAALTRGTAGNGESLVEATERTAAATDLLREEVAELHGRLAEARGYVDARCAEAVAALKSEAGNEVGALRHVALLRYDAFSEMSGRMSFSLALLDDRGDGVTISAICGNSDTRVYAKGIAGGKGEQQLSPEEQQAVAAAIQHRRGGLLQRKAS
jgi:hypothetical protein